MTDRRDFWLTSGFHLLRRDDAGGLVVTDDFLRAYVNRPELRPVAESSPAEIELHRRLLEDPRRAVPRAHLERLPDADARDNYRVLLDFRDRLLAHRTLEALYLSLFRDRAVDVVPLFVDQLVHVILRRVLDGCEDPFRLRAAELFFRKQRVSLHDGAIMLADEETVEMYASTGGFGSLGRLLAEAETPTRRIDLDVLTAENADRYWLRSDRFDMVLDLSFTRPGLDALARVIEAWVSHFLGVEVAVTPVQSVRDERWAWHVGLDATASGILDDLYRGAEVEPARLERLLALFRLEFRDPAAMLPRVAGRPVYLGLAKAADDTLRIKPQNLLVNLPLATPA
jgi:hypothetical protein